MSLCLRLKKKKKHTWRKMPICLSSYFNNTDSSDLIIQTGQSVLYAHRLVVCPHSAYFRNLFDRSFSEMARDGDGRLIVREDHLDTAAIHTVVALMYGSHDNTGSLSLIPSLQVLHVADFWMVQELNVQMTALSKRVFTMVREEQQEEVCYQSLEILLTNVSTLMSKMNALAGAATEAFLKCRNYMLRNISPEIVAHWVCKLPLSEFDNKGCSEFLSWFKMLVTAHPTVLSEPQKLQIVDWFSTNLYCSPRSILDITDELVVANMETRNRLLTQFVASMEKKKQPSRDSFLQVVQFTIPPKTGDSFSLPFSGRANSMEVLIRGSGEDESNDRLHRQRFTLRSKTTVFRAIVQENVERGSVGLLFWFPNFATLETPSICVESGTMCLCMKVRIIKSG
jgi:hypothetical protein